MYAIRIIENDKIKLKNYTLNSVMKNDYRVYKNKEYYPVLINKTNPSSADTGIKLQDKLFKAIKNQDFVKIINGIDKIDDWINKELQNNIDLKIKL